MNLERSRRLEEAIGFIESIPKVNISEVARDYDVSRTALRYRLSNAYEGDSRSSTLKLLNDAEEKAICNYIDRLDRINLQVRPEFVADAANALLRASVPTPAIAGNEAIATPEAPAPPEVGTRWVERFLTRHKYSRIKQKTMDSNRQKAENATVVSEWFNSLLVVLKDEGIKPNDIWNMDETGFRIGIGSSDSLIVTKRKKSHYFGLPQNRESATAIEAISAVGEAIPMFLILAATQHSGHWYDPINQLKPDSVIAVADSGYSNDQLCLGWIEHFNRHSRRLQKGSRRLLILDGHGSHHTHEFIKYCDDNLIIPFGLPPHLTHLLQPLDVCVFQPYKHYHGKQLERLIRDGLTNITKLDFLGIIEEVRDQALKPSTILSAYKKTGIWPFNPAGVLKEIEARNTARTPTPPPFLMSSSPIGTPTTYRHLQKSARKVHNLLCDLFEPSKITNDDANLIHGFIKGSLTTAAELVQTKRDLQRTKAAEKLKVQRRASKNFKLQTGGILKVSDARAMVKRREDEDLWRMRRIVEATDRKQHNALIKWFKEVAKEGRRWRKAGLLGTYFIYETGREMRELRRF